MFSYVLRKGKGHVNLIKMNISTAGMLMTRWYGIMMANWFAPFALAVA